MKYAAGIYLLAFSLHVSGPAMAQTAQGQPSTSQPSSSDVAQQFKTGANRVGDGAVQIGQGIRQGAILTWQAIKNGTEAAAASFNGSRNPSN